MLDLFCYFEQLFNVKPVPVISPIIPPVTLTPNVPVLSAPKLLSLLPTMQLDAAVNFCSAINMLRPKYPLLTDACLPMFLCQTLEESTLFSVLVENLYYSTPQRLMAVWPSRFTNISFASYYVKNPEKLANYVYANRMGNGPENSGDGYRYRGRGALDVTGYNAYFALSQQLQLTLPQTLVYMETPLGAVESAILYWLNNRLTRFTQYSDLVACTKAVNGGLLGLADRAAIYHSVQNLDFPDSVQNLS